MQAMASSADQSLIYDSIYQFHDFVKQLQVRLSQLPMAGISTDCKDSGSPTTLAASVYLATSEVDLGIVSSPIAIARRTEFRSQTGDLTSIRQPRQWHGQYKQ